jgi:hypothetical protein
LVAAVKTHRAWLGADTTITCWVRDDSGKRNLTGAALAVPVFAYGLTVPLVTLDATSPAVGQVVFTITEQQADKTFSPGLYRFHVEAKGAVAYSGLLEVV